MKRLVLLLALVGVTLTAFAQNHQYIPDTATLIVDRYLRALNVEAQKTDSMLYVETVTVCREHPGDTMFMKRWFLPPQCMRAEVFEKGRRVVGYRSNGKDVYREFKKGKWSTISPSEFLTLASGYDFRGPLYNWRINGIDLTYEGEWLFNNQPVYRVLVQDIFRYDRHYLFDKSNYLMFLADEIPPTEEKAKREQAAAPIEWRAIHEYLPVGEMLLPSVESYQVNGELFIVYHTYRYLPVDMRLFNK